MTKEFLKWLQQRAYVAKVERDLMIPDSPAWFFWEGQMNMLQGAVRSVEEVVYAKETGR